MNYKNKLSEGVKPHGHFSASKLSGVAHPSWGFALVEIVEKNSISEVVVFTPQNYD